MTAETKSKNGNSESLEVKLDTEEMYRLGLHLGHKTSRINPKMMPYIYGVRNNIHIIDLEKTAEKFKEALSVISRAVADNKVILVVGTKIQIKNLVEEMAKGCGLPYISERWLGGTFTNFETVKKRIDYFKELERKKIAGELGNYTKKERANFDKELAVLEKKFGGIKNLEKLPDFLFVLDMQKDLLAVKEARQKNVKIIGLSHTNVDPNLADYPIPANDDAISSVKYILDKASEVIKKAKESASGKK